MYGDLLLSYAMLCHTLQVARTSKACIITTGFDKGIVKAVGDAIEEEQSYSRGEKGLQCNIYCMGVGFWGLINRRQDLINKDRDVCT